MCFSKNTHVFDYFVNRGAVWSRNERLKVFLKGRGDIFSPTQERKVVCLHFYFPI